MCYLMMYGEGHHITPVVFLPKMHKPEFNHKETDKSKLRDVLQNTC